MTVDFVAPSAIRIPSSFVRWVTVKATSPYIPSTATDNARPARTPTIRTIGGKTFRGLVQNVAQCSRSGLIVGIQQPDLFPHTRDVVTASPRNRKQ